MRTIDIDKDRELREAKVRDLHEILEKEYARIRGETFRAVKPEHVDEVMILHDQSRVDLLLGKFTDSLVCTRRILDLAPGFLPASNNMSEANFQLGNIEEAFSCVDKALNFDPRNVFALAQKAKISMILGKPLLPYPLRDSLSPDNFHMQLQGLALHGEYEAVLKLAAFDEGRALFKLAFEDGRIALKAVLYASAQCDRAREYDDFVEEVHDALLEIDEERSPAGDENWDVGSSADGYQQEYGIFHLHQLMPNFLIEKIKSLRNKKDGKQAYRALKSRYPFLQGIILLSLRYGSRSAVKVACSLIALDENEQLVAELQKFAQSERLDFSSRREAFFKLTGIKPEMKTLEMMTGGEVRTLMASNTKIRFEALQPVDPRLNAMLRECSVSMDSHEYLEVIEQCRTIIGLYPDCAPAYYHQFIAFSKLEEDEKSDELFRYIDRHFPEYLFGVVERARRFLKQDKFDEASEIIVRLISKEELHVSEWSAVNALMIEAAFYKHDLDQIEELLHAREKILGADDEILGAYEERLDSLIETAANM